jgi:hypothetical protein
MGILDWPLARGATAVTVACGIALLLPAAASAQDDCIDAFEISVAPNTLTLAHLGSSYNCCATSFTHEVSTEPGIITITETEVLIDPCYCICCYDLVATVDGVPPGTISVHFTWYDYESAVWQLETFSVEVPGQPVTGPPVLQESLTSGCGGFTGVHEPEYWEIDALTWGGLKTRYH